MPGYPCCCNPSCALCSGSTPQQLSVVISGMTDGTCSGCAAQWDGTWVVDLTTTTAGNCKWELPTGDQPANACGSGNGRLDVQLTKTGSDYYLTVEAQVSGTGINNWQESLGTTAPNCSGWSSQAVTHLNDGLGECIGSAATVDVSAI